MSRYQNVTVSAAPYADADDSLAEAAADYAADHDLEGWQVTAVGWADNQRDEIVLSVPR